MLAEPSFPAAEIERLKSRHRTGGSAFVAIASRKLSFPRRAPV